MTVWKNVDTPTRSTQISPDYERRVALGRALVGIRVPGDVSAALLRSRIRRILPLLICVQERHDDHR